jgi:hypothetical protein
MITIKDSDNKEHQIEKGKLLNLSYFKNILSEKFNDDKDLICLDYSNTIIKHFIDDINSEYKEIDKTTKSEKYHFDSYSDKIKYVTLLNYLSYTGPMKQIIN